jgi:hypothetical protein|tara:strand:+ start:90 stop:665 length:576 start_codon:yes stop_codon:yes gene_type:complete
MQIIENYLIQESILPKFDKKIFSIFKKSIKILKNNKLNTDILPSSLKTMVFNIIKNEKQLRSKFTEEKNFNQLFIIAKRELKKRKYLNINNIDAMAKILIYQAILISKIKRTTSEQELIKIISKLQSPEMSNKTSYWIYMLTFTIIASISIMGDIAYSLGVGGELIPIAILLMAIIIYESIQIGKYKDKIT